MQEQFFETIGDGPASDQARQVIAILRNPLGIPQAFLDPGPEAEDYVRYGFAPRGCDFRDFCILRHDGRYHVFHIDLRRDQHSRTPTQGTIIGHSSSADLVGWQVHEPPIMAKPESCESAHVYAPYVFPWRGQFHMFYSGQNRHLAQAICRAYSTDLFDWRRYDCNPVFTPERLAWAYWKRTELSDCRDPHVFIAEDDSLLLYYTVLCRDGQVAVAAARSTDLENWDDLGPVYRFLPVPGVSPLCLESACVHKIAGRYVLFFTHANVTSYVVSDSPVKFAGRPEPLWPSYWGIEFVEANHPQYLVAAFKKAKLTGDARLFFGTLDWSQSPRQVTLIPDKKSMAELLPTYRTVNP